MEEVRKMKLKNACFMSAAILVVSLANAQVTGSGTKYIVPVWSGTSTLGDSAIVSVDGNVGIGTGTSAPTARLDVVTASTTTAAITGNAIATSGTAAGVFGIVASANGNGVLGINNATTGYAAGVTGISNSSDGPGGNFFSYVSGGFGVVAQAPTTALMAINQACSTTCTTEPGTAGYFVTAAGGTILSGNVGTGSGINTTVFSVDSAGNLSIAGNLTKGSGSFKIDDPLDPANKYLSHSFVESPDMMNIYNGVVVLDSNGEAAVNLPDYFQALNRDFRYQLTAIGAPGPNLYIAEEISGNRFRIAGGKAGAKVSWQITGVRQDAYANAHRIKVEEDKPIQERGRYLHPELFGATAKEAIGANAAPATALPAVTADTNVGNLR
jgi:trimeric autotransporter adhesin